MGIYSKKMAKGPTARIYKEVLQINNKVLTSMGNVKGNKQANAKS